MTDEFELRIDDISYGGDGVGRRDGMAVFVPFTAIGDLLRVKVTKQKKRFAIAEIVEILEPGESRRESVCPLYQGCGGCQYQHLDFAEENRVKQKQLVEVLQRIGKRDDLPEIESPIESQAEYAYRNKITLQSSNGAAAYTGVNKNEKITVDHCPIAKDEINEKLKGLAIDSRTIIKVDNRGIVFVDSTGTVEEKILHQTIELPFDSFFQLNPEVIHAILEWLTKTVEDDFACLIDAYCGVGVFSFALSDKAPRKIGIEFSPKSIKAAKRHSKMHFSYENFEFIQGKTEDVLPELKLLGKSLIILDPPRSGCSEKDLHSIEAQEIDSIVYVSCNPASLARDLALLKSYTVKRMAYFNMFPRTAHFETVLILERE